LGSIDKEWRFLEQETMKDIVLNSEMRLVFMSREWQVIPVEGVRLR
jgi:hypothetical protein